MFCFPNSNHVMFPRKFAFCLDINYAYIGTWMHMHTGVGWHLNKEKVLWSTISWSEMWKQNNYKLFFFHYSFNHRTVSQALFHVFHHWHHYLMVCSSCKTTCNVQGGWCWGILQERQTPHYSRIPLFWSPKGNGKKLEIAGFRNNRGSVKFITMNHF